MCIYLFYYFCICGVLVVYCYAAWKTNKFYPVVYTNAFYSCGCVESLPPLLVVFLSAHVWTVSYQMPVLCVCDQFITCGYFKPGPATFFWGYDQWGWFKEKRTRLQIYRAPVNLLKTADDWNNYMTNNFALLCSHIMTISKTSQQISNNKSEGTPRKLATAIS
jgi:hypothetical protein